MRQPPSRAAAARRGRISACGVGSARSSRSLPAAASTSPSLATTAPIGTSCPAARSASSRANRIISASAGSPALVMGSQYGQLWTLEACYSYSMTTPLVSRARVAAISVALAGSLVGSQAATASAAAPAYARDEVLVQYRGDAGERRVDVP